MFNRESLIVLLIVAIVYSGAYLALYTVTPSNAYVSAESVYE